MTEILNKNLQKIATHKDLPVEEKHGLVIGRYEDGSIRSQYNYNHDILDGEFKEFRPNGTLAKEGSYWNGKLDGLYVEYYEDGQKHFEIEYTDGRKDGVYTEYSLNGTPIIIAHYRADKLNGSYEKFYAASGQLIWAGLYQDDNLILSTRDRVFLARLQELRQHKRS